MERQVNISGIWIFVNNTPCAHACGYCSTGKKKLENVSFPRLAAVAERFAQWRQDRGLPDFKIDLGIAHSHNYGVRVFQSLLALRTKIAGRHVDRSISLGGLQWRPDEEAREWLREHREIAGIDRVHASLAGYGECHDRWNGRRGDFDYLMRLMHAAAELDLKITQRIFVVNSTLPLLDGLVEKLERLPGSADRQFSMFFYRGFATRLEDERITAATRARLPAYVASESAAEPWYSESEWIDIIREEEDAPRNVFIKLFLTEQNIERIEASSCDDVLSELTKRTHAAYASIPSRAELCERHSDPENTRLYSDRVDIENRWLDRYVANQPRPFERNLTHLWREF